MTRRYELTDQEWEQIAPLLPPEKNSRPGWTPKDNRLMINAMIWMQAPKSNNFQTRFRPGLSRLEDSKRDYAVHFL